MGGVVLGGVVEPNRFRSVAHYQVGLVPKTFEKEISINFITIITIITSAADFKEKVLKAKLPSLVDFYADWCGPCQQMMPVINELAKEYEGKILAVKVNVDGAGELASQYGVMSIPTLILFKDGKAVKTMVGAQTKTKLVEEIEKLSN